MNGRFIPWWLRFGLVLFVLVGEAAAQRVGGNYRLYVPDGEGQHAAVVAIPGCSGVSLDSPTTDRGGGGPTDPLFRRHYPRMAERLKREGYVVLLLDYLTAENVINACSGEVTPNTIAEYIDSAVGIVRSLEFVDPSKVHVLGWSLGGAGVLAALGTIPNDRMLLRSAVAFYPACGDAREWETTIPLLLLLGAADDITSPEPCKDLASAVPDNEYVEVHEYADARHGFDVEEASSVMSTGRGTTIGYNEAAARAAWSEALKFLKQHSK